MLEWWQAKGAGGKKQSLYLAQELKNLSRYTIAQIEQHKFSKNKRGYNSKDRDRTISIKDVRVGPYQ